MPLSSLALSMAGNSVLSSPETSLQVSPLSLPSPLCPLSLPLSMCFLAWRHTVIYHYPGDECDRDINPDNENQYIVWGVGGLGDTAFRHFVRAESEFGETSLQIQYFTAFRHFIQTSSDTAYWPLYGIKPLRRKLANKNFMVDELLANFVTQKRRQGRLLRS